MLLVRHLYFFALGILCPAFAFSQHPTPEPLLNIYLDSPSFVGDVSFLKQEVQFVNYVSDRRLSDVQVQSVQEPVQDGFLRYRYFFFGYGRFAGQNDTVTWFLDPTEQGGLLLEKSLRAFKQGLLSYLLQTAWADSIDNRLSPAASNQAVQDEWGLWVFNIQADGQVAGWRDVEERSKLPLKSGRSLYVRESIGAWQVTPDHRFGASVHYQENSSKGKHVFAATNGADSIVRSDNWSRAARADVYGVQALGTHWAMGGSAQVLYDNGKNFESPLYTRFAVGAEYNLYPYEQFFRRRLLASVSTGLTAIPKGQDVRGKYLSASLTYVRIARWGYLEANLLGEDIWVLKNNYLTLRCFGRAGWNVAKNLFVTTETVVEQNAHWEKTDSDVRKSSRLQYRVYFGLSYFFGSGYRNVVNPRLGSNFF